MKLTGIHNEINEHVTDLIMKPLLARQTQHIASDLVRDPSTLQRTLSMFWDAPHAFITTKPLLPID